MKKNTLRITAFFCCLQFMQFNLQAQTLYGLTSHGGDDDGGTITKFLVPGNKLEVAGSFKSPVNNFAAGFIQASDGKLYGMKPQGGDFGFGAIFFI